MATVHVRIADDLTPRQLVALHQQGKAVYRTAHIGNQYLSNLLLASIGLPLYLYDKTVVGKDLNYHPGVRIIGGKQEELTSQKSILVPYAQFSETDERRERSTPAKLHIGALKIIFGDKNIFTESDLFVRHREKLYEVFSIAARFRADGPRGLFNRYIHPCGCTIWATYSPHCEHHTTSVKRENLADEAIALIENLHEVVTPGNIIAPRGGSVPSLPFTQVLCLLIGFWESGDTTIFELSGPDMVTYAAKPQFVAELNSILGLIAKHAPAELTIPNELRMELVPTADFRFGYHTEYATSELRIGLADTLFRMQLEKRRMLAVYTGEARETITVAYNTFMEPLLKYFWEYRNDWEIFYDIHNGAFFSQHDLLNTTKLAVPDVFLDMTFRDMKKMFARLQAIR